MGYPDPPKTCIACAMSSEKNPRCRGFKAYNERKKEYQLAHEAYERLRKRHIQHLRTASQTASVFDTPENIKERAKALAAMTRDEPLADSPGTYPIDECCLCLFKLFPKQHGDSDEIQEAISNPRAFDVYQGSHCKHMFHHRCVLGLFRSSNERLKTIKIKETDLCSKCPMCRATLRNVNMKRIYMEAVCDEVVLVSSDVVRH